MKKIISASLFLFYSLNLHSTIVFAYHHISDKNHAMSTPLKNFKEQMQFLKDNNYEVISTQTLYDAIKNKETLPENTVVLTFDDGWKNQTQAMDELIRLNMPATFGLVSRQHQLNLKTYLNKDDFEKYNTPLFTWVSHSFTHEPKEYVHNSLKDIQNCNKYLMDTFGKVEPFFIYPYGIKTDEMIKNLKKEGYVMAYSTKTAKIDTGKEIDLFNIPRFGINYQVSLSKFETYLKMK